jgi:hypothetical protein
LHPNVVLLERFYTGIQNSDIAAIRTCYAPNVVLLRPGLWRATRRQDGSDVGHVIQPRRAPADHLQRPIRRRLHRLGTLGSPLRVRQDRAPGPQPDHLRISLRRARVAEHRDSFRVYRWAAMAIGPVGRLAGWTPLLRSALHKETVRLLDRFQANLDHEAGEQQDGGAP